MSTVVIEPKFHLLALATFCCNMEMIDDCTHFLEVIKDNEEDNFSMTLKPLVTNDDGDLINKDEGVRYAEH